MSALPQKRMNVDEFLVWAEGRPGRHELFRGSVFAMTPERAVHAEVKFAVQTALANAIKAKGLPCRMLPDGMTVRIDDATAYEPDALVYCGPRLPPSALEVPSRSLSSKYFRHRRAISMRRRSLPAISS